MTAPSDPSTRRPRGSSLAGRAYWAMVRRVVVIAAAIDLGYGLLFAALGSVPLAWINLASIGCYGAAYWLIGRKFNAAALLLIWVEVLGHAAIGSLLIGWDSGFHYLLLLFIPAIVVANSRGFGSPIVLALLVFYLGLKAVCDHYGPLAPLAGHGQQIVFWVHVSLAFAMSASIAAYYRANILRTEQKLFKQANTDPLTGLHNRSRFQELAAQALRLGQRQQLPAALVLGDVDHFKQVNDRHGHAVGDQVLQHVAELLKSTLRESDVLARWGGEEFLILMPACDPEHAAAAAERLREAVARSPLGLDSGPLPVTLSLGLTPVQGPDDLEAATIRADHALYASKRGGRNQVTSTDRLLPIS